MTYTKSYTAWADSPSTATPATAAKLQNIDDGIAVNSASIDSLSASTVTLGATTVSLSGSIIALSASGVVLSSSIAALSSSTVSLSGVTVALSASTVALSAAVVSLTSGGSTSAFTWPASALTVFVDYTNGSDSNNGRGPSYAFRSISGAYAYLKTQAPGAGTGKATGQIICLPGNHDVGAGVVFNNTNPVEICGYQGGRTDISSDAGKAQIVSSSSAITAFFQTDGATTVVDGFWIHHLAFVPSNTNAALSACMYMRAVDNSIIENNTGGQSNSAYTSIYFIKHTDNGIDNAWNVIRNNNIQFMMLLHQPSTGLNFNGNAIYENTIFYNISGGLTHAVKLEGAVFGGTIRDNYVHGSGTGMAYLNGAAHSIDGMTLINNMGEDGRSPSTTFYQLESAVFNVIVQANRPTAGDTGTLVSFDSASFNNIVIGGSIGGRSGYKTKITDNHGSNVLISPERGAVVVPGRFTTANLPTPANVGQGAIAFDTTLAKLVVCSGSSWIAQT